MRGVRRQAAQPHIHRINAVRRAEAHGEIGGGERQPVRCCGAIRKHGVIIRYAGGDVDLHAGRGGIDAIVGGFDGELDDIGVEAVGVIVTERVHAAAVQIGAVFIKVAEVFPYPPVGQGAVAGIFIQRVMVAEVGIGVGVGPAAVLGRAGGQRLEFGQQSRVNAGRAGVAAGAVGRKVELGAASGFKSNIGRDHGLHQADGGIIPIRRDSPLISIFPDDDGVFDVKTTVEADAWRTYKRISQVHARDLLRIHLIHFSRNR